MRPWWCESLHVHMLHLCRQTFAVVLELKASLQLNGWQQRVP